MGVNKREYVNARMSMEVYEMIPYGYRKEIEVKTVDEAGWEEAYKKDLAWLELKKESRKAYGKLKTREFEIRNK